MLFLFVVSDDSSVQQLLLLCPFESRSMQWCTWYLRAAYLGGNSLGGSISISIYLFIYFPLGDCTAAEQDVARREPCGARLRPCVACICHKMHVMSSDPKLCFFPFCLRGKNIKTNTLTSLLVQFYLLLGFSYPSAACGLKHELKHLKKHSSMNFE